MQKKTAKKRYRLLSIVAVFCMLLTGMAGCGEKAEADLSPIEAGEPTMEISESTGHGSGDVNKEEADPGKDKTAGDAAQGQASEETAGETAAQINDSDQTGEPHIEGETAGTTERSAVESAETQEEESSSEERQEETMLEHEPESGERTGSQDAAWKTVCIGVIHALEEQGGGVCVIDPNSPDGHRCGYEYRLIRVQGDPVPELYYCSVVSSLGEGIYSFSNEAAEGIAQGSACAELLDSAEQILCEGDAAALLSFLNE